MTATSYPSRALLAAIERNRIRVWALCYRMCGSRHDADDLCQESIARAIECEARLAHDERLDGWLVRIATTVCLDHLRRRSSERRLTALIDPLDDPALPAGSGPAQDPEAATILRDDVRFAVIAALQWVAPRQRAALLLHDVCDHPLADVARALEINVNATKALLARARAALAQARHRTDVDPTADPEVVARLVDAIRQRSVEGFTALLDDEVWGVTDGGGVVHAATKPVFGARAVARQFANANRRQLLPITAAVRLLNGEPAAVVTIPSAGDAIMACLHVETRGGRIAALRIIRDPSKLRWIGALDGAPCRLPS